ncbi:bifunctional phosphopantothenoylcysteine decarboxylase/phosphopantothenate--cysteine ligase CoaBC [Candidatus Pantoea carbekii]|uniref:Coenzyme A biosynthesis bifunctional protein CoaBC n=1 Tax=Candidatus Pantoea carbekii TaxID=1235990 RepID=U3U5E1_9GAMM|nr:bifunctional phosphopantothenoylcysteine decarboxylase/phosphopantothenate--cysteine ligase CoaBC [Candidatus Pantoea carbekii]AKC32336.1 coenzyme A biosynthesis bifunctional protein CoaBC [Candidatus Pantoea carbekii]BAO00055.1 CoaBC protein [Candidatus Pantoea carbekii]
MGLTGKKILLGIGGGIAAYKVPELVRRLREQNAKVRIIMTDSAKSFITPLSLQVLSGHLVCDDSLNPNRQQKAIEHIELAKWADLIVVVPATADLISRITTGRANDLITITCLASKMPIAIVPAMNQQMYHAIITQENLKHLQQRGMLVWGPATGNQACGDIGFGRMLEPMDILAYIVSWFQPIKNLQHLHIMITAGPTHEALDPIRYISNYSSGKMGFAIAAAAARCGAQVTLISGPVILQTPNGVRRINVDSALEMQAAVMKDIHQQHIFIANAAVADYRAEHIEIKKIKKQINDDNFILRLIKNPDIVADVAALKKNRPFVVGFAVETQNTKENAKQKLLLKNLDLICANDIKQLGKRFNSDTNSIHLLWQEGEKFLPLNNKVYLGQQLIDEIITHYDEKNQHKNY